MKPEIEERKNWECDKVWKCDKSEHEEPVLVWSKDRKENSLLKPGKSLVDCKDDNGKGVKTDSKYWEKKNKRDFILLDKVFQDGKAELLGIFVPFWKRLKIGFI
jgi:hypothetical protein